MGYTPFRKEWDINNDQNVYKKKVGANAFQIYNRTISKMGFSARDFAANLLYNIEADGTILWVSSSSNCTLEMPD